MNDNEKAAFIYSQSVCALVEALGMQAENMQRMHRKESLAYNDEAFFNLQSKYLIGHNDVITYLKH